VHIEHFFGFLEKIFKLFLKYIYNFLYHNRQCNPDLQCKKCARLQQAHF